MSKYHIIRYVLDVAYGYATPPAEDAAPYWRTWLQQIARMFVHRQPPSALLEGLKGKGNVVLRQVCEEWQDNPLKPLPQPQPHKKGIPWHVRHEAWIARRDAGNARVAAERKKQRDTYLLLTKQIERQIANEEADMRNPVFDAQLRDLVAERDKQMASH